MDSTDFLWIPDFDCIPNLNYRPTSLWVQALRRTMLYVIERRHNEVCNQTETKVKSWVMRDINPFTADPVKALHFAILA